MDIKRDFWAEPVKAFDFGILRAPFWLLFGGSLASILAFLFERASATAKSFVMEMPSDHQDEQPIRHRHGLSQVQNLATLEMENFGDTGEHRSTTAIEETPANKLRPVACKYQWPVGLVLKNMRQSNSVALQRQNVRFVEVEVVVERSGGH